MEIEPPTSILYRLLSNETHFLRIECYYFHCIDCLGFNEKFVVVLCLSCLPWINFL